MTLTESPFFTPLKLDTRMEVTAWALFGIHLVSAIGLFLVWNDRELLPAPWMWWVLQLTAAAATAVFLRWPRRGTCAAAGAFSFVAFFGRALSFLWVLIFDRGNVLVVELGMRFLTSWAMWASMAVMVELLWWWISGAQTLQRQEE
jgi:hypothetical protein